MNRVTVSLSQAVDSALSILAMRDGLSKSRCIDTLLREHPRMQIELAKIAKEPDMTGFAVGRDSAWKKGPI